MQPFATRPAVGVVLTCLALTAGCGPTAGTDVGNGAEARLDVRGYEEQPPAASSQSLTTGYGATIDALFVALDRFRFVSGGACKDGGDEHVDAEGTRVADLLGEGLPPDQELVIDRDAGAYCGLRVGLDKMAASEAPANAPPELVDLSIYLAGSRADSTPFVVKSTLDERFELEAEGGSFPLAAGGNPMFLAFELSSWMEALDVDALGPGPIEVSDSSNSDALKAFEDAVKKSMRLFRDDNGDGQLEMTERESGDEIAK